MTHNPFERIVVHSLNEALQFASEDEERDWWATHDLAPELGEDVTEQQRALIQELNAKHRCGRDCSGSGAVA